MAWRMVKQPNGLLARFSEIVDNFTDVNLTVAEAVELCKEYMGTNDAVQKVQRGIDSDNRWDDAIDIIRRVHGDGEVLEVEALIREYEIPAIPVIDEKS